MIAQPGRCMSAVILCFVAAESWQGASAQAARESASVRAQRAASPGSASPGAARTIKSPDVRLALVKNIA